MAQQCSVTFSLFVLFFSLIVFLYIFGYNICGNPMLLEAVDVYNRVDKLSRGMVTWVNQCLGVREYEYGQPALFCSLVGGAIWKWISDSSLKFTKRGVIYFYSLWVRPSPAV